MNKNIVQMSIKQTRLSIVGFNYSCGQTKIVQMNNSSNESSSNSLASV